MKYFDISYGQFQENLYNMAMYMKECDLPLPKRLFGIPRGGAIVANYLGYILDIKEVHSIPIHVLGLTRQYMGIGPLDIIVDDIYDTGKSYLELRGYLPDVRLAYFTVKQPLPEHALKDTSLMTFWRLDTEDYVRFPWEYVNEQNEQAEAVRKEISKTLGL